MKAGEGGFSELELVAGLRDGDRQILTWLYGRNYPIVRVFVLANSGTENDAKDVFQEGITAIWNNIFRQQYVSIQGKGLEAYLVKICRYRWLERIKSAAFRYSRPLSPELESGEPDDSLQQMVRREEIEMARRYMSQLGDRCRRILYLFYFHKRSMDEIAGELDLTAESAKNQKYRCLKQLRERYLTSNERS
jgi:RNA polymerase sigma factor (sigma-70 family)